MKAAEGHYRNLLSNIQGDLCGALSAAVITLPMSIGYGMIAFGPLGPEFAPKAAIMGVYGGVFAGFFAAMFGGTSIQITGPKAPVTLVFGTLVAAVVASSAVPQTTDSGPSLILAVAACGVLVAGLSQLLMGVFGFGNLLKYVPQPVVGGFMNGIAILLIYKQIRPLMGLDNTIPFDTIAADPSLIAPFAPVDGIITIVVIFVSRRRIKLIPSLLVGLCTGTVVYHGLKAWMGAPFLGPVIGGMPFQWPTPDGFLQLLRHMESIRFVPLLPHILVSGLVLGVVGSMESLFSSVVADDLTTTRHNSRQELVGQGIGQVVCSFFGALPGAGSIPRSIANFRAGGRTRLSGMMCGVFLMLMVTVAGPLVGEIPSSVIAAIVFVVGITLIDSRTVNLLRHLPSTLVQRKDAALDLFVIGVVSIVTISINLMVAVGVGVLIASALFIARMGKTIVRRKYFGDQFHSRKMRSLKQTERLERVGHKIAVLELQGPLFFGPADYLAREIEGSLSGAAYCIIDMKRVTEIDSTGVSIICQIERRMKRAGKHLVLTHLKENSSLWWAIEVTNGSNTPCLNQRFMDTDGALEWAEDMLLREPETGFSERQSEEVPLSEVDILRDFTPDELEVFRKYLIPQAFQKGEPVFHEGDESRDLYFLTKGSMTVRIRLPGKNSHSRLFTYAPGVVFGEMAFLDGNARSAGIWAHEDSEVLCLRFRGYQTLQRDQPIIANKLVMNIARELSRRLRRTSNQVRLLEEA